MATVLKTVVGNSHRGFESHPLRQLLIIAHWMLATRSLAVSSKAEGVTTIALGAYNLATLPAPPERAFDGILLQ